MLFEGVRGGRMKGSRMTDAEKYILKKVREADRVDDIIKVTKKCIYCKKDRTFELTQNEVVGVYDNSKYIQEVLARFNAGDREMFISGICPDCWDGMFGGEEDE